MFMWCIRSSDDKITEHSVITQEKLFITKNNMYNYNSSLIYFLFLFTH